MTLIAMSSLALFKSSIAAFKSSLASEYWLDNCKPVNIGMFVPKLKLVLALLMSLFELSIGEIRKACPFSGVYAHFACFDIIG